MPPPESLPESFDPELTPGAANAIHVCLRVQPSERVTLITDEASAEIAAALVAEIRKAGAECAVYVLEDFGPRPHQDMPVAILEDLAE
jgi:aminopeptidase